ncbi:hypothetical protein AHAS_Ahas15G0335000 [Arachis hypogaea]
MLNATFSSLFTLNSSLFFLISTTTSRTPTSTIWSEMSLRNPTRSSEKSWDWKTGPLAREKSDPKLSH